ncbi:MAG: hypothetical protein J5829_00750 [Lachnospiraceae bacterium]|nr:hypothetical protein [Lachnospiraceae bacterium]
MAKGFGKFLFGAAIAGAAAAGVYYWLKSGEELEDFDDFDDDDVNDELEEFLEEEAKNSEREYVPLDLSKDRKAEEGDRVIGNVNDGKENVVKGSDEAGSDAKDFKFTDLTED